MAQSGGIPGHPCKNQDRWEEWHSQEVSQAMAIPSQSGTIEKNLGQLADMAQSGHMPGQSCEIWDGWEIRHSQDVSRDRPTESGTVGRYSRVRMYPGHFHRILDSWEVCHSQKVSRDIPAESRIVGRYSIVWMHLGTFPQNPGQLGGIAQSGCI